MYVCMYVCMYISLAYGASPTGIHTHAVMRRGCGRVETRRGDWIGGFDPSERACYWGRNE